MVIVNPFFCHENAPRVVTFDMADVDLIRHIGSSFLVVIFSEEVTAECVRAG